MLDENLYARECTYMYLYEIFSFQHNLRICISHAFEFKRSQGWFWQGSFAIELSLIHFRQYASGIHPDLVGDLRSSALVADSQNRNGAA